LGQTVVAGFSTHPHWDHLLWHAGLGMAPRYGTARCAATVRDRLSDAGAKARIAELIPPDIVEEVPRRGRFRGMAQRRRRCRAASACRRAGRGACLRGRLPAFGDTTVP
jgi:hypothetical protein